MGLYNNIKNTNVITISQGSTYSDTVTLTGVDLTTATVTSQLRKLDGTLAAEFTVTKTTPLSGIITRWLSSADTTALTPSTSPNYVWGVQYEIGDTILPEVQGGALVIAEVVHA